MLEIATDSLGPLQTFGPLLGGFGIVIWLGWRLFWKVDRRSQMELAIKDKRIKELELELETERTKHNNELNIERTKRFAEENARARAEARETSLETQIADLAAQVNRLREEVRRLREGDHA
jgi:hypothetical protein